MKKFAVLTLSLLTALSAAGGITANAAVGGTIYPTDEEFIKTLTFSSLTDYAVEGELYAFTDGTDVKVYDDGEYSEYRPVSAVTDLDIKDGVIYCGCADEKAYTIPAQSECEYSFPQKSEEIPFNGYLYFIDADGMNIYDKSSKQTKTYDGEYTNLKQYGEKVYAIKENSLYEFTGTEYNKVVLNYADYAATHQIVIGQASTALKSYMSVTFVEIEKGAFMTAVDLEQLNREYFVPLKTVRAAENTPALLLCDLGNTSNAALIAVGDTAYILLKEKLEPLSVDGVTEDKFSAQITSGNIYASPYIAPATVSSANVNDTVKIISKLESSVLKTVFYEVEYTSGEKTEKGYVAAKLVSLTIIEDNKKPTEIPDPNYSESSDTKTILIIFAVVLLVLAAVGYISHVSAKGKKKGKKKNKDKDEN